LTHDDNPARSHEVAHPSNAIGAGRTPLSDFDASAVGAGCSGGHVEASRCHSVAAVRAFQNWV
jgi:hypothetical protein